MTQEREQAAFLIPWQPDDDMTEATPQHNSPDAFADLPMLISVPVAAKLLGISRAAAYRFASAGDLPTKRLGRRVYVVSAKLREFIESEAA
jgi:predicted DNA-binding transcriptional regulator AlpA